MKQKKYFAASLLISCLLTQACGVKAPPIAPERKKLPVPTLVDCSPYDPECDQTDENYTPQKKK